MAVAALVIAGCESPRLDTQTAQQQDLIGPLQITTPIESCSNDSPVDNTGCFSEASEQLLVGYRVPVGAVAPDLVHGSGASDTVPTTFHLSPSYASELQRLVPAATGEQWVGYISDQFDLPPTTTDPDRITLAPGFEVPSSLGGNPFSYGTVVGLRNNVTVTDATREVVCNATDLTSASLDGSTTCVTDPVNLTTLNTDTSTDPTRVLQFSAGPAPTVHAGDTATVPFDAKLIGAALPGGTSFPLSASSPLAGGTAAPGAAAFTPAPGDNAESATLKVPASSPAGDYPVTLTATSGGTTRSATGTVHVLAVPGLVITFSPHSLKVSKSGVATLPISCPSTSIDPCAGSVTLNTVGKVLIAKRHKARKRALKLGSGKFTLAPGASGTVKIKLSSTGRKALARTGKLSAKATFVMVNRAGTKSTTVKRVTLHGPKARKHHKKK
jgi:hypothetical protein